MKIYFACSITGGRDDEAYYKIIVDTLLADGHEVPTAHLSSSDVMSLEDSADPVDVYERDMAWIESCHALVAEVSTPSHGVGYEISSALTKGKPVLCLHNEGLRVSKMLTGNIDSKILVRSYRNKDDIPHLLKEFLSQIEA
ncbi:MAG: nucleoside 2-deoxyribosyltransferase [Chloroflexota bacterium]|nr:MAG: nucleoside 2-deoxyribosyltransferase [Chloroflexota bacterium]UCF28683.1 MAG: nucleoside 2-deoxyribosyltransferase [Chloroflexota bacterium]